MVLRWGRVVAVVALVGAGSIAVVPVAGAQVTADARIGAELEPTAASVAISQATWGDGVAIAVVIGRNDVFADNLGGTALAGFNGPLLLTDGGPDAALRPEVRAEVTRVLADQEQPVACDDPQRFASDVYLLGGPQAVSPAVEQELASAGLCVERLEGPSRVETSVAVAEEVIGQNAGSGGPQRVFVARADDFADSATGGAFAARFGVPIVVNPRDTLHAAIEQFLTQRDRLFDDVALLGGEAALTVDVQQQIEAVVPEGTVRRLAGATRDDTARVIAEEFVRSGAGGIHSTTIANGFRPDAWVWALTGGVTAGVSNGPMLYVQPDAVPEPSAAFLSEQRPRTVITLGPEEVVHAQTAQEAAALAGR